MMSINVMKSGYVRITSITLLRPHRCIQKTASKIKKLHTGDLRFCDGVWDCLKVSRKYHQENKKLPAGENVFLCIIELFDVRRIEVVYLYEQVYVLFQVTLFSEPFYQRHYQ